jgi:hypothetical protein
MERVAAEAVVVDATGRDALADALDWIARGARLRQETDLHLLLMAICVLAQDQGVEPALRRLTRKLAVSDVDTAAVLLRPDQIPHPAAYEQAMRDIALHCPEGSLAKATASALLAAQRQNPLAVEALCLGAGLSYGELQTRVDGLPSDPSKGWQPSQIRAAFDVLDKVIRGSTDTEFPGAVPARPLELLKGGAIGDRAWMQLERQLNEGVPYGVLLAQRAAGGTWLAHRNRTSSKVAASLADQLCHQLEERSIPFARSAAVGGDVAPSAIQRLTKSDKQIGIVVLDGQHAVYAVIISVQRDSGSASKAARKLIGMRRPADLPTAILVAGPGWAARNETAELAVAFKGRLFSDSHLSRLVEDIAKVTQAHTTEGEAPR